jgi:hypothetical protein
VSIIEDQEHYTPISPILVTPGQVPATPPIVAADPAAALAGQHGSLASVLHAGLKRLEADAFKVFAVPGWDTLRLTARKIREDEQEQGDTAAKTIALATAKIELCDEDGQWHEVQHGWRGIATMMGRPDASTSEVIGLVFDNAQRRDYFSAHLVSWMFGVQNGFERLLGE